MSLEIQQRDSEGIVVLDLKGTLTLGHDDLELRDRLAAVTSPDRANLILNLKEVSQIDSTGLGTLVFGLARLRKAGGRLALANVDPSHLQLFVLTKLALSFEFYQDEHAAVDSFFPDRTAQSFDVLNFVHGQKDTPMSSGSSEATC